MRLEALCSALASTGKDPNELLREKQATKLPEPQKQSSGLYDHLSKEERDKLTKKMMGEHMSFFQQGSDMGNTGAPGMSVVVEKGVVDGGA